jgi:hypothetical protein
MTTISVMEFNWKINENGVQIKVLTTHVISLKSDQITTGFPP